MRNFSVLECVIVRTFVLIALASVALAADDSPPITTIIQRSVDANQRDFDAVPHWNNKERDRKGDSDRTYQVTIIDGSPYNRLIAINGKPLGPEQQAAEMEKEQQERRKRDAETPSERAQRIAKYNRDRAHDNEMMKQLTAAFNFTLTGTRTLRGRSVYVLRAIPKPGYRPPNTDAEVLTGMQGEMWIDAKTFQWVKVTAQVLHPVSIGGFLAQVQPGTRFELEKIPVEDGRIWMASHFNMRANARVLYMFNHNTSEDDTFWDYTPAQ